MPNEYPLYKSHKTVRALEIKDFGEGKPGDTHRNVWFKDDSYPPALMPVEAFARYTPVEGDFLVVYEDGYKSFSPRKAFVEGYTLAE